ncbi:cupredoxin domain-containing protein [Winogradskyella marincola]|uniref:Cupredoxin domain-containing protein n=1 Tax=Winogradskyella marincola TaxID=3037795 RepID=A0ABT6FZ38_9FLAO|nr:cupredoxin domain-containing protein [Winogradskyella sp. YYF002]MDG4715059.1 cupredoxin domain-containing protein [Winogradskyella sp. YYF002]
MKKLISILIIALSLTLTGNAQDHMMNDTKATVVTLEQTKGKFTKEKLTLSEGDYVFNIKNNNVGHDVGFVLVKKGEDVSNPDNHIKSAYVTKAVKNNSSEKTKVTTLSKGEYIYFCPLNPTPQYNLTVK